MTSPSTRALALLERLRACLAEMGHELLDTEWRGWSAPYRFRCAHGHEVCRTGNHASRFLISCPTCRATEQLGRLQQLAQQAGGECLSETYTSSEAMYRFRCRVGHEFEARAAKIISGSWCKHCARLQHSKAMRDPDGLSRLQAAAQQRGGTCLTPTYTRMSDSYRFRCAEGHEWQAAGADVIRGTWCKRCANTARSRAYRRKDGLPELQRIAQSHGGHCLAERYEDAKTFYRFRCAHGHEWTTNGARIFRGAWCVACAYETRRVGIDAMREIAAQRGGLCLSDTYVNNSTKLEWECARGHRWHAAASTIRAGHWCAQCHYLSLVRLPKTRRRRRYEAVEA